MYNLDNRRGGSSPEQALRTHNGIQLAAKNCLRTLRPGDEHASYTVPRGDETSEPRHVGSREIFKSKQDYKTRFPAGQTNCVAKMKIN